MREGRDPRTNWELGWRAIKRASKEMIRERNETEKNRSKLEDQLYDLWLNIGESPSTEEIELLAALEGEARKRKRNKANL